MEAIKILTKAQFVEEGEKSTRFFLSLEKCRRSAQNIRVLTKDNMDTVTETRDLLGETFSFYKHLYTAQPCDEKIQREFLDGACPELVENARDSCEGEITTRELKRAVDAMEKDKSPGLDGITTNCYKHFWHLLGDKLVQVYNHAFRVGRLSVSQRRGVISLLFKKGDRTQLKNWRPITPLTIDYKILSKALADRLHEVLPLIIHSDQTASIRVRTINDNARLLHGLVSRSSYSFAYARAVNMEELYAYFLRISNMDLGKLSLVLEYPLQRIDRNIPAFHMELLSAWVKHEPCRLRTNVPTMATDILNEPLFLNSLITLHDGLLFFKDWIAAGLLR